MLERGRSKANLREPSPIDYTFGLKSPEAKAQAELEQIKKMVDVNDKNAFAIAKENVELKGVISELKEQLIKRSHTIEGLNSEIKLIVNDMKYMH